MDSHPTAKDRDTVGLDSVKQVTDQVQAVDRAMRGSSGVTIPVGDADCSIVRPRGFAWLGRYLLGMASTTCGRCEHRVHMTMIGHAVQTQYRSDAPGGEDPYLFQGTFACDGCHRLSLCSIWRSSNAVELHGDDYAWDDGAWEPQHVQGKVFPNVPFTIADVANEAYRCHSIHAFHGSVLLARTVLEATAKDHGITTGRLVDKIDQMATQELLPKRLAAAAHQVRHIGNDAAHADYMDAISAMDSEDALTIMDQVLAEVYEGPARIAAMEARRTERRGGA